MRTALHQPLSKLKAALSLAALAGAILAPTVATAGPKVTAKLQGRTLKVECARNRSCRVTFREVGSRLHVFLNHSAKRQWSFAAADVDQIRFFGSKKNDLFDNATAKPSYAEGKGGNDELKGGKGDDHLIGGNGNDTLWGVEGNDRLEGRKGNDVLEGGNGDDVLLGHQDKDKLRGGPGNDRLDGGQGRDKLWGDVGDDILRGDGNTDELRGGAGNDRLHGGKAGDLLHGGPGDDQLVGGQGDDKLRGDGGTDRCAGGEDDREGSDTVTKKNGDRCNSTCETKVKCR